MRVRYTRRLPAIEDKQKPHTSTRGAPRRFIVWPSAKNKMAAGESEYSGILKTRNLSTFRGA
jgi:hypothetical protein